jgi:cyclic beta-1,2-glucan synthetase
VLDPPLAHAHPSAGYIQAYPSGIRENGGQYNHGAVWALMALAQQGDAEGAWAMFEALSPAHRAADPKLGPLYGLEPYVAAGDIYSQPPYAGRGGWSWYTGSAAWLQRAALESICGLVIEGRMATITPCLPPHWPQVELVVRRQGREQRISVCRDDDAAEAVRARHVGASTVAAGQPFDLDLDVTGEGRHLIVVMGHAAAATLQPLVAAVDVPA